jgi:hypothetical protein
MCESVREPLVQFMVISDKEILIKGRVKSRAWDCRMPPPHILDGNPLDIAAGSDLLPCPWALYFVITLQRSTLQEVNQLRGVCGAEMAPQRMECHNNHSVRIDYVRGTAM